MRSINMHPNPYKWRPDHLTPAQSENRLHTLRYFEYDNPLNQKAQQSLHQLKKYSEFINKWGVFGYKSLKKHPTTHLELDSRKNLSELDTTGHS